LKISVHDLLRFQRNHPRRDNLKQTPTERANSARVVCSNFELDAQVFADNAQRASLAISSEKLWRAAAPASGAGTPVAAVCAEAALTKGSAQSALFGWAFGTEHIA